MGKKLLTGYLVFCIVFFVALVSITAIRVKTRWDHNYTSAKRRFDQLNKVSSSLYLSAKRFESETFLSEIRKKITDEPRLLLVAIYTKADGLFYLFSKSQEYLKSSNRITAQWEGNPSYQNHPVGSAVITAPLLESSESRLFLDGLYVIFGRNVLFPILKETFIVLFVFFIATCIVLLIIPGVATPAGAPGGRDPSGRHSATGLSPAGAPAGAAAPRSYRRDDARRGDARRGDARRNAESSGSLPELATAGGDQTEDQRAHRRDSVQLFSPDTGLGWSDHLPQRIKFEIDRAAATDQDLTLALISLDNYGSVPNKDTVYARIARMLLEEFTFQDLAFEYREASYALIVPDTDLDMGISRLEGFQNQIASEKDVPEMVSLCIGLSSRNGRLVNGATLLTESLNALKRAQSQGKGSLIAFRADPEKYRDFISKKV